MKYTKPQLNELPPAIVGIKSGTTKGFFSVDNIDLNHPINASAAAYEADE